MRNFLSFKNLLLSTTVLLLALPSLLFAAPKAGAASENYKTKYNVTYATDADGMTHATLQIGLTNLTSKYYASSYKLRIGFPDIENIKASDRLGAITPVLKKLEDGYQVELTFNDKVVGIGNTVNFTISFDAKSIAQKHGNIWDISIPATANQESFSDFTITVKPHASFGIPVVIRPHNKEKSLVFSKEDLGKGGVSITFGQKQLYAYKLTYHLKNNNVFPIQTEIALPPSTNYQDSFIDSISPKPNNVLMDTDGNWLAQYSLGPSEKKEVIVKGKTEVFLTPKKTVLTQKQKATYTKEQTYWQLTEEQKSEAQKLRTPKAIYDYVVKTLEYDYERRTSTTKTRIGAKDVLSKPNNAVCLEFTDLFIALARNAGIPAREVDGFAYTDNKRERPLSLITDVLHAWPEYYDEGKKTWIMIDPTWGDTTSGMDYFSYLDLNHLVFVIKGTDSNYPVPAGGYKLSEQDLQRDVEITFIEEFTKELEQLSLTPLTDSKAISGFPINGAVSVANEGSGIITGQKIVISSKTLSPSTQTLPVPPLPPGGTTAVAFAFHKTPFLTNGTHTFTITIDKTKIDRQIAVTPFLITKWHILGGLIFAILTITVFIITYKTGRLPFFGRKR